MERSTDWSWILLKEKSVVMNDFLADKYCQLLSSFNICMR